MTFSKKAISIALVILMLLSTVAMSTLFSVSAADPTYFFTYSSAQNQHWADEFKNTEYMDDGSVRFTGDNYAYQHQMHFTTSGITDTISAGLTAALNGDGIVAFSVTLANVKNYAGSEYAAQIQLIINNTIDDTAYKIEQWQSVETTKTYKMDVSGLTAENITGVTLSLMDYSAQGSTGANGEVGCGDYDVTFTPIYVADGSTVITQTLPTTTLDPNNTNPYFITFGSANRMDYGNSPDKVIFNDDGSVTGKSINCAVQNQMAFSGTKDELKTAIATAQAGTNTLEITVSTESILNAKEEDGLAQLDIRIFTKADSNGYAPSKDPQILAWQKSMTRVTYYLDISEIHSWDNVDCVKVCAQNYWYYNEKGQVVEIPNGYQVPAGYTSAAMAPTVTYSALRVSNTVASSVTVPSQLDEYNGEVGVTAPLVPKNPNGTTTTPIITDPNANTTASTAQQGQGLCGDVNNDSKVNGKDSMMLKKFNAGALAADDVFIEAVADVNSDGKVNGKDSMVLKKYNAGVITALPYAGA